LGRFQITVSVGAEVMSGGRLMASGMMASADRIQKQDLGRLKHWSENREWRLSSHWSGYPSGFLFSICNI